MEIISIGLLLLIVGFVIWRRTRGLNWQLRQIKQEVNKLSQKKKHSKRHIAAVFRQLYAIINKALETRNETVIYQAIDVLKLAAGTGLGQRDEPLRLMAVTVTVVKAKQPDAAGHLLDAFRPLVRRWGAEVLPSVLNPLMMVASIAMKEKNNFLAAKVMDLVFTVMERPDCQVNDAAMRASFRAMRTLGLFAIRRKDEALFREIATRLTSWAVSGKKIEVSAEVAQCLYAWLHRIVKNNGNSFLTILDEMTETLTANAVITGPALVDLLNGWIQLAGNACLNPNSQVGPLVVTRVAAISLASEDAVFFRRTVRGLVQVIAMALTRYTLQDSFLIILPLADMGRKLLQAELTFGPSDEQHFRPQALYGLVHELLVAFEILARQRMTVTAGEIIGEFCELWQRHPATADRYGKTARKFCQLLLTFWMENRRAKARRLDLSSLTKNELTGFTQSDREKLRFMLGIAQ